MYKVIFEKLKTLIDLIAMIDKKLGFYKFIQYFIFIAIIVGIFNFSSIVETVINIQNDIEKKEHEKRLLMRDELMNELNPLLVELRTETGSSRVLYFEYHNSTENFAGIPFKFANLVLTSQEYGCPRFNPIIYKDINSGLISGIYDDLKRNSIIINKGIENDSVFYSKYPEIHNFFSSQDGSVQQVFINLPGVNFPMGMIVLEWVDKEIISDKDWEQIKFVANTKVSRINALISKYTP